LKGLRKEKKNFNSFCDNEKLIFFLPCHIYGDGGGGGGGGVHNAKI
jgi:hypothetical protein